MLREGIEIFHRSPCKLRENSGDEGKEFTFATEVKFVHYISGYKILEKIVYMTSLSGAWRCSNTTYMTSALSRQRKASLGRPSLKTGEVIYVRVHSHGVARNDYYSLIAELRAAQWAAQRSPIGIMGKKRKPMS